MWCGNTYPIRCELAQILLSYLISLSIVFPLPLVLRFLREIDLDDLFTIFISISDDNVPTVVTESVIPTPCCYTLMSDPPPGHGYPINVTSGFCHEPDHVQLHLGGRPARNGPSEGPQAGAPPGGSVPNINKQPNQTTNSNGGSVGAETEARPAGNGRAGPSEGPQPAGDGRATPSSSLPTSAGVGLTHTPSSDPQRCDKLLWPSASLNVTTSKDAVAWNANINSVTSKAQKNAAEKKSSEERYFSKFGIFRPSISSK